jgi:hypothetical protein
LFAGDVAAYSAVRAMPIQIEINHPDRLFVAIARGSVTLIDLVKAFAEISKANIFHYRKILDVTSAVPAFAREEVMGFIEHARRNRPAKGVGLVAFVAEDGKGEFARMFVELVANERPAQVFRSIHEARKWLYANSDVKEIM